MSTKFNIWETFWMRYKKNNPRDKNSIRKNTSIIQNYIMDQATVEKQILLAMESNYELAGRPYYNIHGGVLQQINKSNIDDIKTDQLDVPGGLSCVNLRLPTDPKINQTGIQGFLVGLSDEGELVFLTNFQDKDCIALQFIKRSDKTLKDVVATAESDTLSQLALQKLKQDVWLLMLKIVVTAKFLTDCPDENLIQYDIISKFKSEYQTATTERRKEIEKISKEKGHYGWNIGHNELILLNAPRLSEIKERNQGNELRYAHLRTGHPHTVRFGKGKEHAKIVWYRPTVVRKDLPFKG